VLSLPPSTRIFICTQPADMRRSFDGLAAMTQDIIGADPMSGHLFVFRNKRGDRAKILYWDRSGFCLFYKHLEKGVFHFPTSDIHGSVIVEAAELMLMLEGIQLAGARRRPRFIPKRSLPRHNPSLGVISSRS